MTTFLLAWNPRRFQWGDLHVELDRLRRGGSARDAWTVGSSTIPRSGDRFFLIRLGEPPRGIVASGKITSSPYEADHWDQDRASKGDKARYVGIDFDVLSEEPLIEWNTLMEPPLSGFRWATQMSGIRLPPEVASAASGIGMRASQPRGGAAGSAPAAIVLRPHAARCFSYGQNTQGFEAGAQAPEGVAR